MRSVWGLFPAGQVPSEQSHYLELMTKDTTNMGGTVMGLPKSFYETWQVCSQSIHNFDWELVA